MAIMTISRLMLLISLITGDPTGLPMDLDWDAGAGTFLDAAQEYADAEDLELARGVDWSVVDDETEVTIGQFGVDDANDADLSTVAYFDDEGYMLAIYAGTKLTDPGEAFMLLPLIEELYADHTPEYRSTETEAGLLRTFSIDAPQHSSGHIVLSILERADADLWEAGVTYIGEGATEDLWYFWEAWVERRMATLRP